MAGFVENINKLATDLTTSFINVINSVKANEANITMVSQNIADIDAVVAQVIPSLPEILLADDNAATATTQAGIATAQATIATTKAGEASASASAALASELSAASLLDQFDDRYLGSKESDPVVDNDGNTLLVGALYWSAVLNKLRVWDGTAWSDALTLTPSSVSTLTNKTIDAMTNTVGADHVHYKCRNVSGSTIAKGVVVTAQGTQSGTDYIEIVPVTDPQTQIALGVTHVSIANNGTGLVLNTGVEEDRDTSAWAVGTILYPDITSGFTSTKPTTGRYQACAVVLRQHNNHGTLLCEFTEPKYLASTTQAGYVQLNNTLTSTSTTEALTAAQGKVLQDRLATVENGTVQEGDSVTLTGDVTGTATFDSSGNVSVVTVVADDSHTHNTKYLAKDNATPYSPVGQYEPATKAYVDAMASSGGGNVAITQVFRFIGDGTTTSFNATYIPGSVSVVLQGMTLDTSEFVAATGTTVVISPAPAVGDVIHVIAYGGADVYTKTQVDTQLATKQPLDATLTAIAGVTTANDKLIYANGVDSFGTTTLTAAGRALLDDADAAAQRTTLGISATNTPSTAVGGISATNVQAALQELDTEKVNNADIIGAIGNINSPLLDMPLKNSLAMKAGVGSATFTRASTATYIDRYGVLKTAAVDEPRFEKEGYLNEGSSTNLLTYSEQFDNAAWVKARATITANTTETLDPYGTNLADKLIDDTSATTTHVIYKTESFTSGTSYTLSWFVKAGTLTQCALQFSSTAFGSVQRVVFDLLTKTGTVSSGTPTYKIDEYVNGWVRISITSIATATTTSTCECNLASGGTTLYTGDGTGSVYIFGAQLEALPFATSYIPTTSATVTRSADSLTITRDGNIPKDVGGEFSVLCDVSSLGGTNSQGIFGIAGYSVNDYYYGGAGLSYNINGLANSYNMTRNTTNSRIGLTTTPTTLYVVKDGVIVDNTSTVNIPTGTPTFIRIGNIRTGTYPLYGHISNIRIYDKALTAQEVALA